MYFQYYKLWKPLLENSLKSTVSEHALTVNMWKRPKYLPNLDQSAFFIFFILLREVDLENVSPSFIWTVGVFLDTLTSDGKYIVQGCYNFQLSFQT